MKLDSMPMARPKIRSVAEYVRWVASQGGKARGRALTPEERSASAQKAARARWREIGHEQRREIARKAARARWRKAKKG